MEELRVEATEKILLGKVKKGLTWTGLSEELELPVVWLVAAVLGQHPIPKDRVNALA